MLASRVVFYTFAAIVVYLLLVRWRGANALLGTGVTGYVRAVRALQGR